MSSLTFLNNLMRCMKCEECLGIDPECIQCLRNKLKSNFINWTSGNTKIDNFIQEKQLKVDSRYDIIFEWIPYNQFNNMEEMDKDGFTTAKWENGLLHYQYYEDEWIRIS